MSDRWEIFVADKGLADKGLESLPDSQKALAFLVGLSEPYLSSARERVTADGGCMASRLQRLEREYGSTTEMRFSYGSQILHIGDGSAGFFTALFREF
ncbi:hypothetical protein A2Z33_03655 [Candidatus Gottesmanbacteria bacterium RBG_16_52_11]|uniref:Uncharacterized protein n=1 Tax=Candidatus Gottesmanbacteria bacterium RBG_16_52_11 TaxID=1798374 RepID=A0A1F5YVK9_9BACT|nr:MAG: hypothetical protein A2Z33_03655 [Candidatus Gottesmanbacteria bacterium RBG_16_52_11]